MSTALVCAHRGASRDLPDNSMAAFVAAISSGCDVIETDVRMGRAGRLVLAHDTWDVEHDDVVELADLVELARGRVGLDLEIVEAGLERAVLDVVDGFPNWLIVTSIFPEILTEVARLAEHMDTGLVVEAPYAGHPFEGHPDADRPFALADSCGARVTLVEDDLATPALFERARGTGQALWVWTVNDRARLTELLSEPAVSGVVTDDPALACELRAELAAGAQTSSDSTASRLATK